MKKRVLLFACLGVTICLHAQTDSLQKLKDSLRTVTVTATRTIKDVMDVGRSVTVISGDQLKQAACNTVAELLSQQEGIFIVGTGQNPGAIQSLFLRGSENYQTMIMVDGVPLADPSTDHGEIDLTELSLADVDRIEIVRGSHSTLYGSSAIGGVINIITKKNYTPGVHLTTSFMYGEFGPQTSVFDENMLVNYTFQNGLYMTGGIYRVDDKGLNATVDTITHPLPYQMNPDRDNYDKTEVFTKIGFHNSKWDIYAEYKNTIQNSDADASAFNDLKSATDHFVRDFYTWGLAYKLSNNLHLQYTGSYSHDFRAYTQGLDTVDQYGDVSTENDLFIGSSTFHDVKLEYDYKTSQFIVGGGYSNQSMKLSTTSYNSAFGTFTDNPDTVKFQQSTTSAYVQADVNGGTFDSSFRAYNLLLGARFTSNSAFGSNVSYEINPSVKILKNNLLYLSYSTGFSTPSLYELYAPNKYGDNPVTSYTLGNPSLKAEESNSLEIGIKHAVSSSLSVTLAWFQTTVNNHIDYVALWNPNKPIDSLAYGDNLGYRYVNLGQEMTQGFEIGIFLKPIKNLSISGNVSLLTSTLKYNTSNVDTAQTHNAQVQIYDGGTFLGGSGQSTNLLRRPGTLANASITWKPLKRLAFNVKARYVGTRYDAQYDNNLGPYGAIGFANVSDYTLFDASVSYNFTENCSGMIRCENILNTTYYEILGYTTRGRSIYFNLRFSL